MKRFVWRMLAGWAALVSPLAAGAQGPARPAADTSPATIVVQGARPGSALPTYRLNAGDDIEVYVWGDERLQRTIRVLPDGSFAFPLAGTVAAMGRTPVEVEGQLSKLLAPQYKGVPPQVTVSVKTVTGMQVSVIGKVRSPGTFSPTRYINLLDALTLAGGPSDFADVGNIVILRHDGMKMTSLRARLGTVLKGRPSAEDLSDSGIPQLVSGDTVIVP